MQTPTNWKRSPSASDRQLGLARTSLGVTWLTECNTCQMKYIPKTGGMEREELVMKQNTANLELRDFAVWAQLLFCFIVGFFYKNKTFPLPAFHLVHQGEEDRAYRFFF